MRNQPSPLNDSKNQFMVNEPSTYSQSPHEKQSMQEYQKMFMMFQKMATDPSLFMKLMSSAKAPEPEIDQRKREFQVEQHKYRNHEISPKRREAADSPLQGKENRKKGTDVLGRSYVHENDSVLQKYFQAPSDRSNAELSQSNLTRQEQYPSRNQQRPIQSAYANANNQRSQPPPSRNNQLNEQTFQKSSLDDDRPIKPAKGYNYEMEANQSSVSNSNQEGINPSKYWEAEERPIKGIQGDFKTFIMKEQGFPMSQSVEEGAQNQEDRENDEAPKARTFLKRGSRQYLSSAKDRSVPKAKGNQKVNQKQQLDLSTSYIKQNGQKPQRSISQNRVLGRKSISSKSITKKAPPKPKPLQDKKTLQYSNTTSNYNSTVEGNRTPRISHNNEAKNRENSASPTFQLDAPNKVKEGKKNIFQQSSSDQEQNKRQSKTSGISMNKTQVIPGVFLSKKQLHQILSKHGKSNSQSPSTNANQNEIQELKAKYIDLCNILAEEKQIFQIQMQKQKQQFELYKTSEMAKIKNQRKVQQRNLINTQKNKEKQKEKQQFQMLKKTLEKERQQFRHKQKNYKLMVEKYKKLAQQKQKVTIAQETKVTNQISKPDEIGSTNRKKTTKAVPSEPTYIQLDQGSVSSKGADQNVGYQINKKPNDLRQKEKLPNYQDLRKSNLNPNQNGPVGTTKANLPGTLQTNASKKYEYYEQTQQRETKKPDRPTGNRIYSVEEEDNEPEQREQQEGEQIVQYNRSMRLSDLTKIPLTIKMVNDDMIDNLFRCDKNPQYRKYLQLTRKPRTKIHSSRNATDKKVTNIYADGGKEIVFDTGVRKEYFSDGYVIIFFSNGDIKQKLADETVLYFYKDKDVDHITLPNKINIYRFDNNQVEFHFPDNTVQVRHPDGTINIV